MNKPTIIVVSGTARSGTSMLMRILEAGGVPVLTDNIRTPDYYNPKGYYEYEPYKLLPNDVSWMPNAINKAVKILGTKILDLPSDYNYKIIFIRLDRHSC